jgi:uncharacterized protein YqcC (DUF446 family)
MGVPVEIGAVAEGIWLQWILINKMMTQQQTTQPGLRARFAASVTGVFRACQ